MKKQRKVSVSISLPLERLVYLTKRVGETDMSTSEYMEMLLIADQYRQTDLEEMVDNSLNDKVDISNGLTAAQIKAVKARFSEFQEPTEEEVAEQVKESAARFKF